MGREECLLQSSTRVGIRFPKCGTQKRHYLLPRFRGAQTKRNYKIVINGKNVFLQDKHALFAAHSY